MGTNASGGLLKPGHREVFQEGIRGLVHSLGDADVLGWELEAASDGFNVRRLEEATVSTVSPGPGAGFFLAPVTVKSSSDAIAKHDCLFLPTEFKPADMVSAATSTDSGAGGLTVHEGLVSFRFDVHFVLIIWDSLNSLFASGGSTALLASEEEYEKVKINYAWLFALGAASFQTKRLYMASPDGELWRCRESRLFNTRRDEVAQMAAGMWFLGHQNAINDGDDGSVQA